MATEDTEVTIELTPLGHDEGENHRVIKMNNERPEVEIGRASKSLHKGLNAASDNAWFDYPILSRAHAKFTLRTPLKVLYIQDCGSTHGTYFDSKRLEEGAEYTVRDGEVITFGQRVTSGAVTYPAKKFRVHSQWKAQSPAVTARLLNKKPISSFQVPDDSNDSSSDQSREASIQILDSHPRTFSVPSSETGSDSEESDVESIEIASSVQGEDQKDSVATSPDHGADMKNPIPVDLEEGPRKHLPQSKVRGLNLKGPTIMNVLAKPAVAKPSATGSSQQNAINLEEENPHKDKPIDDETDDEGPEILPIQQKPSSMDKDSSWDEPEPLHQQFLPPTAADYEGNLDTEDQIERLIVETQARIAQDNSERSTRHQSPELSLEPGAAVADSFDSTDDDGFDHDDDFSIYDREDMVEDALSDLVDAAPSEDEVTPMVSEPCVLADFTKPHTSYEEPSVQKQNSSNPDRLNVSVSNSIDVSQVAYPEIPRYRPTLQRAPSPSDAALARNSSPMVQGPNVSGSYDASRRSFYEQNAYATQIGNASTMNQGILSNAPFGYQYLRSISYPELPGQDTHSRPYDQGPFIKHYEAMTAPTSTQCLFPGSSYDRNPVEQVDCTAYETPHSYPDVAADARYAAKLQAEEDAYASTAHLSVKAKQPLTSCLESRKGSEGQSSKINIASLVNASHMENSRPPKRKAEEMSTSTSVEESHSEPVIITSTTSLDSRQPKSSVQTASQGVQETQLPDAQPRDTSVGTASLSQDSTLEPIDVLVSNSRVAHVEEAEGPPQKKARKSSSSSKGIGKFVSGVCVGLVGAVAAFVATIPASVREEALREMANAA